MPNYHISAALAFLLSLSAFLPSSWAQAPLSPENASALLQKSLSATNLKSSAKQPFHLTSTVKYKANGPNLTGRVEILFAAPDRYRINVNLGKISETQIALGDKLYISRSPKNFSAESWRIAQFLWHPGAALETPSTVTVGRETTSPTVKVADNCEEEYDALRIRKACFDPSTQGITSFSIQDQKGSKLTQDVVSLSDFRSLGASRYPGHLTKKSVWDTIDVTVDSLTVESAFDESTFTPPSNSLARDWCASPEVSAAPASGRRAVVEYALYVYYVLVGADGRSKSFSFVNDPVQFALPQARQALESKRYPVLTCSGKPIEYDLVVVTNFL